MNFILFWLEEYFLDVGRMMCASLVMLVWWLISVSLMHEFRLSDTSMLVGFVEVASLFILIIVFDIFYRFRCVSSCLMLFWFGIRRKDIVQFLFLMMRLEFSSSVMSPVVARVVSIDLMIVVSMLVVIFGGVGSIDMLVILVSALM